MHDRDHEGEPCARPRLAPRSGICHTTSPAVDERTRQLLGRPGWRVHQCPVVPAAPGRSATWLTREARWSTAGSSTRSAADGKSTSSQWIRSQLPCKACNRTRSQQRHGLFAQVDAEHIREVYEEVDVYVQLALQSEGFGVAVLQAESCGLRSSHPTLGAAGGGPGQCRRAARSGG